jgi:fructose-1,6-bisphosphatase I
MKDRGITLTGHIMKQRQADSSVGKLSALLSHVGLAAKMIAREAAEAGLDNILGNTGQVNVQGEEVKKLDRFANDAFIQAFEQSGLVCTLISEEMEKPLHFPENCTEGSYILMIDPVDGSSNIDVDGGIGSIFSFYRGAGNKKQHDTNEAFLRKGSEQIAAGYVLYGPSTMLVYTSGQGVHGFTLHPGLGEFYLTHENIKIPAKGKVYSVNEGNYNQWQPTVQQFVSYLHESDKQTGRPYSGRYVGALVADFHRTILQGGLYLYPGNVEKPEGKLRLLYEGSPLAYVVEQAGGRASTGTERILDIQPKKIHQRVPLFIGSREDVMLAEEFVQGRKNFNQERRK